MYFEHETVRKKWISINILSKNKQHYLTFRYFLTVNEETCGKKYEKFEELTYDF